MATKAKSAPADPSATPDPTSVEGLLDALNNENAPSGASSSAKDLFGLGEWSGENINPGDLPVLGSILGSGQQTTGNAIMQAFASGSPTAVAQIQRALYLGGYYSSSYTPTYGVIGPKDITAFGNAVQIAGKTKASVSTVLLNAAQYGTAAGVAAAASQGTEAKTLTVSLPNTQDLEAEAVKAFQAELGRKATPSEAAAFAASYRAMSAGVQRTANQAQYDAETGAGSITTAQAAKLQTQVSSIGAPIPGQPVAPPDDQLTTHAPINEQLQSEQSTPGTAPDFSQEMNSLGGVASEAQQDATPTMKSATSGLTQDEQETPESAANAAENFAQNAAPGEAEATGLANQFDNFLSILGTHFGGT